MKTTRVCIEIDSTVLEGMKDVYRRLMNETSFDKRTFEEWVADIAVWGQKGDKDWLMKYGKEEKQR